MLKIGMIRCEKNEDKCPLTGCFKCLLQGSEGFAIYGDNCEPVGIMTCRCPGNGVSAAAKILKNKGAEAIHLCTCIGAGKIEGVWTAGKGYCDHHEELMARIVEETNLPCVLGTAHLPAKSVPDRLGPQKA